MTYDLFQASNLTKFCKDNPRRAQEFLPQLMERLVQERAPSAKAVFPWGNHISKAGYDGEVTNRSPNIPHVPQGKSVWEMGSNGKAKEKFREDLKKRSEPKDPKKGITGPLGYDPKETVFCFVTPQKFTNRSEELQKSPYKDQWQGIKIYDADDLRSWLKTCPKTELWVAGEIGALPKDKIEHLQDFYNTYAAISPATNKDERKILPPAFLLAGREEYIKSFQDWLAQERPERPYLLQAETAKEAAAFIYASLYLSDLFPLAVSSLIVHSKESAEALSQKDSTPNKNLLLIITSPDIEESLCQTLTNKGWKVIWAVDRRNTFNNQRLKLPWQKDLSEILKKAFPLQNQQNYNWAGKIATQSGRSINRLLSLLRDDQSQKREEAKKLKELLPAILAGSFSASSHSDREILSLLSGGKDWDELEEIFENENTDNRLDGKLIKIGSRGGQISWHIRAPQAELIALIPIFRDSHGRNLKKACLEVLGGNDNDYSSPLPQSLAQSLAIMGSFPDKLPNLRTMRSWAQEITAEIFKSKGTDLIWWGGSDNILSSLAEASPDSFLENLEKLLTAYPDAFKAHPKPAENANSDEIWKNVLETEKLYSKKYLRDRGNAILWTLGTLAWMPDYFDRIVDLLVRICASAGKKSSFRNSFPNPPEALEKIFAPWNPQAGVSMEKRHKALERILTNHPDIGWNVLIEMLPQTLGAIMTPSSRPNYREFQNTAVTWQDWQADIKFAAQELVKLAETEKSDTRWAELIKRWEDLFPHKNPCLFLEEWHLQTLATLQNRLETNGSKMKQFRSSLYEILAKPRVFEKDLSPRNSLEDSSSEEDKVRADWALSQEYIKELEALLPFLESKETKDRFLWAFERKILSHVEINAGLTDKRLSDALRREQQKIASKIIQEMPLEEITKLAQKVKQPADLGRALAELNTKKARQTLRILLNIEGQAGDAINFGLFQAHPKPEDAYHYADELWQQAIKESWGDLAEKRLLSKLPASLELWQKLDTRPEEVRNHYWQKLLPAFISGDLPAKEVFKRFREVKRPEAALKWALHACRHKQKIDAQEIVHLLEKVDPKTNTPKQGILDAGLDNYTLGELLNLLEKSNVPCETLAELEKNYYSLLRYSHRGIKNIFQELSKKPDLFVELIRLAYSKKQQTEKEQKEAIEKASEEEKRKSLMASHLLYDWMKFRLNPSRDAYTVRSELSGEISNKIYMVYPGWDYGKFNADELHSWIESVQEKLKNTGREDIGDSKIGEILAQMASFGEIVTFPEGLPKIFEEFATEDMEEGLYSGLFNRRGVVTKSMFEGGKQEYALAEKYLKGAKKLEDEGFPKMAKVLRQLGENYQKEAQEADNRADRKDLTGIISF